MVRMLAMPYVMNLSEAFTVAMMLNPAQIIDEVKWMAHRSAEQYRAARYRGRRDFSVTSTGEGRGIKSCSVRMGECSAVQCSVEEGRESRSALDGGIGMDEEKKANCSILSR
jgi:hypothetical protein